MLPIKRPWRVIGVAIFFVLPLLLAWYLLYGDKFSQVGQSGVYRSAQPGMADLAAWIDHHGLRAVLNLRGPNPEREWYQRERALLEEKGVMGLDFPLNARELPSHELLRRLVQALQDTPRPLLVHCQHGNDRSGLAALVVRLLTPGDTLEQAWAEVSPWRGVLHPDTVGRQFLQGYTAWLAEQGLEHGVEPFLGFVEQGYRGPDDNLLLLLDRINGQPVVGRTNTRVRVGKGEGVEFSGWAFDPHTASPLAAIRVLLDDQPLGQAQLGLARADVAAVFSEPGAAQAGWRLRLEAPERPLGCGLISLELTRTSGRLAQSRPQARLCFD